MERERQKALERSLIRKQQQYIDASAQNRLNRPHTQPQSHPSSHTYGHGDHFYAQNLIKRTEHHQPQHPQQNILYQYTKRPLYSSIVNDYNANRSNRDNGCNYYSKTHNIFTKVPYYKNVNGILKTDTKIDKITKNPIKMHQQDFIIEHSQLVIQRDGNDATETPNAAHHSDHYTQVKIDFQTFFSSFAALRLLAHYKVADSPPSICYSE